MHIAITKGLNIPIEGAPQGRPKPLANAHDNPSPPKFIALDVEPFPEMRFTLLAKLEERVAIGQPILEDKGAEGRMFVSPASGKIVELRRGLKRRLLNVVIEVDAEERYFEHDPLDPESAPREALVEKLKAGGIFTFIRKRPFNLIADPNKQPRDIFVKAIESAPFAPPFEFQVEGHEHDFQLGLSALSKLTSGAVHLVYPENCTFAPFLQARHVQRHTAQGPHPIGNQSIHIESIAPIQGVEDVVWTLNALDVVKIGHLLRTGRYLTRRIVGIGGPGLLPGREGYFQTREGVPIETLVANRIAEGQIRFVSGDPLMGRAVTREGFLGIDHHVFSVIPENKEREFLHFFRLGGKKYSFSRAYASGHRNNDEKAYYFTTSLHGEHRPFIDAALYERVMPLPVPTMHLVKAVMAEDFDLAEELGLLSVAEEDFALPAFVCPSKMEMTDIIHRGLTQYAKDVLA